MSANSYLSEISGIGHDKGQITDVIDQCSDSVRHSFDFVLIPCFWIYVWSVDASLLN